jgi:hypothetical protein
MTLNKIKPSVLNNATAAITLETQLKKLLTHLRELRPLRRHLEGHTPATDFDEDGTCWLGLYDNRSRAGFSFYVGFGLRKDRLFMYVQRRLAKKTPARLPDSLAGFRDTSFPAGPRELIFREDIAPGSKYDGNPEAIERWFLAVCRNKILAL